MKKADRMKAELGGNMQASIEGAKRTQGAEPGQAEQGQMFVGRSRDLGGVRLQVAVIEPDPGQPRKSFDQEELENLAASMKLFGQIQPITVRWHGGTGRYRIVTGERRWRAAKLAGLTELRAIVMDEGAAYDDVARLELQLIENLLRADMPPVEQANAFHSLMKRKGWSARGLAARLCLNPATVSRSLALLGLGDELRAEVEAGRVPPSTAAAAAKVKDPVRRAAVEKEIVATKPTRAEAERVARCNSPGVAKETTKPILATNVYRTPGFGWLVRVEAPTDARAEAIVDELEAWLMSLKRALPKRKTG